MRIQMIAPTPFFAHRGCHVRILEEMRALSARGHEVALCTYRLGDDVPGVRTVRTVRVPWYRKLTAGPSWHKLYLDVLLLATSLRFAARFRPDVIHAHLHEGAFLGTILARLGGVPLLADFQGSMTTEMADHGFFAGWPWGERVFVRLEGWINRAAREVVV
ncbi:MAG: glycosyltransferase, partial [Candidatus Binatia bacterium]